jgi:uncharacterized protein YybS (DUF2232 family)
VQRLGHWLLSKNIHAGIIAFVCTLLPLVGLPGAFLASIIVALVTLRKGYRSGLIVLAWVAVPAIAILYLHEVGSFDVLLVRCIIVWMLAGLLKNTKSWPQVLYLMVIIGVIGVSAFHLLVSDPIGWWSVRISAYLASLAKEAAVPAKDLLVHTKSIATIATGITTFVVLIGIFLQLLIARFWQAAMFNKGGLRQEALNIRVNYIMSVVIVVAFIAAMFHVMIVRDWMPVLFLPFVVAGFSFLHMCVEQKKVWVFGLALLYIAAVIVPYLALLVALIGFIDSWLDLRSKYKLAIQT